MDLNPNISKGSILPALHDLGWGNGFNNPFADKSNKELEELLEKKQRCLIQLRTESEDMKKHVVNLHNNSGYLENEILFSQTLINTKRMEMDNERTLTSRMERFSTALNSEIAQFTKEIKDYTSRKDTLTVEADRQKVRLDDLISLVETDSGLLEMYELKKADFLKKVDESTEDLKIDGETVLELEKHEANLIRENKKLVSSVTNAAIHTARLQDQFTHLSTEFRKAYRQRNELVTIWSTTLDAMKARDNDLIDITQEYQGQQRERRKSIGQIELMQIQLKSEISENEELQAQTESVYKKSNLIREKLDEVKQSHQLFINEKLQVNTILRQLSQQIHSCELQRQKNIEDINAVKDKCSLMEDIVNFLKIHKKEIVESQMSHTEYVKELVQINAEDVKLRTKLEYDFNHTGKMLREKFEQLKEAQDGLNDVETKYWKTKSFIKGLRSLETRYVDAITKNQSTMYKIDLEMSAKEARISKYLAKEVKAGYYRFQDKLSQSRKQYEESVMDQKYIQSEIDSMNHKFYTIKKELEHLEHERRLCKTTLRDVCVTLDKLIVHGGSCESILKDLRMFHSLRLVDKKRLKRLVTKCNENIFSKSQHHFTVEAAVKERKSEISYHLKLLTKLKRQLKQITFKLTVDISSVERYNGKMKSRFDQLSSELQTPYSDGTPEDSFTQQIRRATKVREELGFVLKQWEERVSTSETEMDALSNVLLTMRAANSALKESLSPAKANSNEIKQSNRLIENEKKAMVLRNRCQRLKTKFMSNIQSLNNELGVLAFDNQECVAKSEEKMYELSTLQSTLQRFKDKTKRWKSLVNRKSQELAHFPEAYITIIEKELHIKAIGLKYDQARSKIQSLISRDPKVDFAIKTFLDRRPNLYNDMIYRTGNLNPAPSSTTVSSKPSTNQRSLWR